MMNSSRKYVHTIFLLLLIQRIPYLIIASLLNYTFTINMTDTKKAKRQKTSAQAKPPKVRYAYDMHKLGCLLEYCVPYSSLSYLPLAI